MELLHYPRLEQGSDSSLSILARIDFPIYITTSPHRFLEAALKAVGKRPLTQIYRWREDLNIPDQYVADINHEPWVTEPLVYHLYGIDNIPASLVLTEDDHIDFLVSIIQDFREVHAIPTSVRRAISNSTLLLLGYEMHGWDLKTLLKGPIKQTLPHQNVAIQLEPTEVGNIKDPKEYRDFLTNYFGQEQFEVFWGTPEEFLGDLWRQLQGGWE